MLSYGRLFSQEVDMARKLNIRLGVGIGMFQGLANIALNGEWYNVYLLFVLLVYKSKQLCIGHVTSFYISNCNGH
jgi:hypothetical protein